MIGLFLRALSEDRARLTPLLLVWKIKFCLKIQPNARGNYTNKEASTVFCSVVKHLGSGRALRLVFSPTLSLHIQGNTDNTI